MHRIKVTLLLILFLAIACNAQMWQQNDQIFNPSGVPSLPFSQPRFADLDNDNDMDMILGNISGPPLYFENSGSNTAPSFQPGEALFSAVEELDCEVGVCTDLDADGDLDFISGGYRGLQMYENTGTAEAAVFEKVDGFFDDLSLAANPVPHFADMDSDGDVDLVIGLSEQEMYNIIKTMALLMHQSLLVVLRKPGLMSVYMLIPGFLILMEMVIPTFW